MEDRSTIQIVKPGSFYNFESVAKQSLMGTGDINQIVVNPLDDTELILACQRGLFIAHLKVGDQ